MTEPKPSILPTERIAPVSRAALAATVVAVLACGLVFNFGFAYLLRTYPRLDNATYLAFTVQWQRLVHSREPVKTLIIGDSCGAHGIDPDIIDAELDTYSLNACTMGDAALISPAWQLEWFINRHGPPRRVILPIVHDVWKRDLELPLIPRVPMPWGFWSSMRAPLHLDAAQTRDVFLARYAPVYSQDMTLRELLMYPWRPRTRVHFNARGFAAINGPSPDNARRDGANHLKWTAAGDWTISDQSREALLAMIAMADEYGFDLYVVNSPQLEGMVEDEAFGRYYAQGQAVLKNLVATSPRAHLLLSPPAEYPADQMQNSDHIAGMATPDYTRRIAAGVRAAER